MTGNDPYEEKELLRQIVEGDEQAFAQLYARYAPRLKAYGWKFTNSESDSSESLT